MEEWWEEALDVDDSDLPSLLRPSSTLLPCNSSTTKPNNNNNNNNKNPSQDPIKLPNPTSSESCNRTGRLIPGPAGAIQSAMLRQNAQARDDSRVRDYRTRDEFPDEDFNGNPWLCALDFLGLEVGSPLPHSIKTTQNMERVPQIVGIIKSCTPNGIGDLIVTLKDPTGTIGASIHRKVLAESLSGKDISVGSVVILQQAVAFSPTRYARYLNVTPNNVVKIISKNCEPPPKRSFPAFKVRHAILEEQMEIMPRMVEKVTSVSKVADGVANGAVRRDAGKDEGMAVKRRQEDATGSFDCSSILNRKASGAKETFHETSGRSGVKNLIPRVSLAGWTDEQLHELFDEDE